MTAKSQLPMPLDNAYFEPSRWRMPLGLIYVSVLTDAERADPQFVNCKFIARTAAGEVKGAFEFVSDALNELTSMGYDVAWQLVRGEPIDLSARPDDGC